MTLPRRPASSRAQSHAPIPDWLIGLALALAAGLSRGALWTRHPGEPDSARYLIGIAQWLAHGPRAPMIYDQALSAGYYRLALAAAPWAGSLPRLAGWLNALSALSAAAAAPLAWALARRWLRRGEALAATLLWIFSPGFWWLGLEPHPQAAAIACGLLAFWAAAHALESRKETTRLAGWWLAGMFGYAVGLMLKSDLLLMAAAFPALAACMKETSGVSKWLVSLLPGASLGIAWGMRGWLMYAPIGAGQAALNRTLAHFLRWPQGVGWARQLLPVMTGLGLGAWLLIGLGLAMAGVMRWRARPNPRSAGPGHSSLRAGCVWWMLASWGAPPMVFWLLIGGNNTRHIILFTLPWLWAGLLGWQTLINRGAWSKRARQAAIATLFVIPAGLNALTIPPNSNMTLYPSANVPASERMLAKKERQMQQLLARMEAASRRAKASAPAHMASAIAGHSPLRLAAEPNPAPPPPGEPRKRQPAVRRWPVCYLGWYGNPYLEYGLLRQAAARVMRRGRVLVISTGGGASIAFLHARSTAGYIAASKLCRRSYSLEYDARGRHRWFLGAEWRNLPGWRRWFPGGRTPAFAAAAAANAQPLPRALPAKTALRALPQMLPADVPR